MMEKQCIKTLSESLIWLMLSSTLINKKTWVISLFIQNSDQSHLVQEKNVGLSHAQDLQESMLTNSKLNHSNYKKDYGETITLMLKENAGEKTVSVDQENQWREPLLLSSWTQSVNWLMLLWKEIWKWLIKCLKLWD